MLSGIRRIPDNETESSEAWERLGAESYLTLVEVQRLDDDRAGDHTWLVGVAVMEFIREEPFESELRNRIVAALTAVDGVTAVDEEDREVWTVAGDVAGPALVEAVALVIDDLADRLRSYVDELAD